ncbi:hypothetical protein Krac_0231 [Ktedonobacter racemifer DSM 44963]|uniref:Uncharacterized protein n=1 Tax=Ktedonobacter racemifer DSM 44963 TaxID=485913 RepID=D6U774_KTERA|nr:hypothetical protein Krac_0231 [Ktedonobacter racemifer DSM 44963]
MGLTTQILPALFLVILLFSPKARRIKRLKVQSYLHSGFVDRKAFLLQELRPKWSGYESQLLDANAQANARFCTDTKSDRTLAKMTQMLTSSSRRARKDARELSHREAERTCGQDISLRTKEAQQR